ncbi:MAG: hypothetical protein EOO77_44720, partial [Oxalobacteraceae bacterium]
MPWFAIGELLVGTGQILVGAPPRNAQFYHRYNAPYHRLIHYGLAGAALEAAPLKLARIFERRGQDHLAAGCIAAATLGRALLQVARIPLCSADMLTDGFVSLCVTVLQVGVEVGLRLAAAGARYYRDNDDGMHRLNLLDHLRVIDSAFLFARDADELVNDPAEVATDSHNVNTRIAKRADDLMRGIAATFESNPDDLAASRQAITEAEAN